MVTYLEVIQCLLARLYDLITGPRHLLCILGVLRDIYWQYLVSYRSAFQNYEAEPKCVKP